MTAVFTYDVTFAPLAPDSGELRDAFEAERHAQEAADEVIGGLSRAQLADVEELPPGAEYLLGEADARREALELLLGLRVARRRVVVPRPAVADWRDSVARMDWSKGRGA